MNEINRSYSKIILKLATPVMIAMLAQMFVNQIDSIMVGHLPTEVATPGQAGIGVSLKFLWIIGGFLSALGVGTLALVARRYGEEDFEGVSKTVTNSLFISTITSLILSLIAIYFSHNLISLISSNSGVLEYGVPYLQIRFTGVLSMVLTAVYKSYFDGLKKTHVHMVASIVMNIANIFVNWLLIFGNWGFPKMGVNGAALASAICTYIGLGIMIFYSFKPEFYKHFKIYNFKNINKKLLLPIVKLSIPAGVTTVVLVTGFLLFDKIVAALDPNNGVPYNFTVNQLITNVVLLLAMIGLSFGTVTATLVGNSMGEKNFIDASKYGWVSSKIGALFMGIVGLVMIFAPSFLISLYNSDPELVVVGGNSFRVMGFVTPLIAVGMILSQANFGAGNTKFVMIVEMTLHFGFLVPVSYLMTSIFKLGITGAWITAAVYIILLSSTMMFTFYRGKWKNIQI
ncbi:MATE family efflux transporter [bacterium]|nr:MATE family efflux transporter [bacterium]